MNKLFLILITACLSTLLFSCETEPSENGGTTTVGDKAYWYNPKILNSKIYEKAAGDKDFNLSVELRYQYDNNGRLIRFERYESPYGLDYEEFYEYHGSTVTHTAKFHYKDGSTDVGVIKITYNEPYIDQEPIVLRKDYYNGFYKYKTGHREYDYDDNGNLLKEAYFNEEGELGIYTEYEYDEQGRLSRRTDYKENGEIARCQDSYVYNGTEETHRAYYKGPSGSESTTSIVKVVYCDSRMDLGRILSRTVYDENMAETGFWRWEYDSLGRLIKHTTEGGHYQVSTQNYTYDGYVQTKTQDVVFEGQMLSQTIEKTEYLH